MRTFHVILSAAKGLGIKRAAAVAEGEGWTGAERAGGEELARNPPGTAPDGHRRCWLWVRAEGAPRAWWKEAFQN